MRMAISQGRVRLRVWVSGLVVGLMLVLMLVLGTGPVWAGDVPVRGPEPAWVVVADDEGPAAAAPASEGMRVLLFDTQYRADEGEEGFYARIRNQALSAQALPLLGNVTVVWSPASQDVILHHVEIIRDGATIDVLADQAFETLRREENLGLAMLDGRLTAVLQPAGLRVGDILDVAYTVVSRDPVTRGHAEQALDLNLPLVVDRVRYRASWPSDRPVRLHAADDWTPLRVQRRNGQSSVEVALDAAQPIAVPTDVPGRLKAARRIELSDYRNWSDIAVLLKPYYDRARTLEAASPLKAEIERIRALSDDPAVQAAAALRLVQDEVRYVALLMGEGALAPASADETWRQRLGDCKAKTVLLLALLDGLGIEADPAAVSIDDGDGMDTRLPRMGAFNHVLVRAVVGGQVYWLDGARTGDRSLAGVPMPTYHWALPLTGANAALVPLIVPPLTVSPSDLTITLDASAGLQAPAAVSGTFVARGDGAVVFGGQLALVSEAQKDQAIRAIWLAQMPDLVIARAGAVYDVETNVLTVDVEGTIPLSWDQNGLIPPGATYQAVTTTERPAGPFRNAPYAVNHPTYSRTVVTVKLPQGGQGFRTSGGEIDRTELAHHLRRHTTLIGDTVVTEVTMRSMADEITAAEADAVRIEEAKRPWNPPRIFSPELYRTTEADRAAMTADTPTTAEGWLDRAFALSSANDLAGAIQATDEAIRLAPDNSSAWANRGLYRLRSGDRANAVIDLEKAVEIDPSERIAMNGNAMIAMMDGQFQDAVVEMSRALRQAPNDPFALNMRAQAYRQLKQYDRALRDTDSLIAALPDNPELKLMRISILEEADRHDEADAEMDALALAEPGNGRILLNQAALKMERGDAQAAIDILDRALPLYPDRPEAVLISRAGAAIALGRVDLAERDFATIRDASATDPGMLNNMCWTAAKAGVLLDQALRDCDAALALAPNVAGFLDSRGRVLLQRGDLAGAVAAYDMALERSPTQSPSLYGRGLARIALGQVAEGEADKAAALAIDPDATDAFKNWTPSP